MYVFCRIHLRKSLSPCHTLDIYSSMKSGSYTAQNQGSAGVWSFFSPPFIYEVVSNERSCFLQKPSLPCYINQYIQIIKCLIGGIDILLSTCLKKEGYMTSLEEQLWVLVNDTFLKQNIYMLSIKNCLLLYLKQSK